MGDTKSYVPSTDGSGELEEVYVGWLLLASDLFRVTNNLTDDPDPRSQALFRDVIFNPDEHPDMRVTNQMKMLQIRETLYEYLGRFNVEFDLKQRGEDLVFSCSNGSVSLHFERGASQPIEFYEIRRLSHRPSIAEVAKRGGTGGSSSQPVLRREKFAGGGGGREEARDLSPERQTMRVAPTPAPPRVDPNRRVFKRTINNKG